MSYSHATVTLTDASDLHTVRFNPASTTPRGYVHPANIQVMTSVGVLFLAPDVARALIEQLQSALIEAEAVTAEVAA